MCNYAESELDMTAILLGSTVVHVKPDVMRFEVTAPNGTKWIAKVTIEDNHFRIDKDE